MKISSSLLASRFLLLLLFLTGASAGPFNDIGCAINVFNQGNCFNEYQRDASRYIGEGECCIFAKYQFCLARESSCELDIESIVQGLGSHESGCSDATFTSLECLYYFYPVAVVFVGLFIAIFTCLCCLRLCCFSKKNPGSRQTVFTMRQDAYNNSHGLRGAVYQETTRPLVYVAPSAPILTSGVEAHALIPPPSYEEIHAKY